MRIEFVSAPTRARAARLAPWAARIAKVEGGYRAFESVSDYDTWRGQR